jgi:hypothetical protein
VAAVDAGGRFLFHPPMPKKPPLPIDAEAMQRAEAYLARGRIHEAEDTAVLKAQWVEAFRRFVGNLGDPALARAHEDLQSELRLRGEEPPFAEVEKETEAFFDRVRDAVERVKRNPGQYAELLRELGSLSELARGDKDKLH